MSTYEIEEDSVVFRLDSMLYNVDCVMKTAYLFLDRYYVYLAQEEKAIIVKLTQKERGGEDEETQKAAFGEFCNELLNQVVREKVGRDTKHIRDLIVTRALYSTYVDESEEAPESDGEYGVDDIARNWFDKDGGEE